jgi:ElaB/YqjD/DUF883 family membrane-anchored ribosome-binding protein
MTNETLVPGSEQEALRQQISESRGALAEKLEMLEGKVAESVQTATDTVAGATASVVETVQNATASVSETVGNVTHSVSDTVKSVVDSMDLSIQIRRHPWATVAGAVAVGYLSGRLLSNGSGHASDPFAAGDWRDLPRSHGEPRSTMHAERVPERSFEERPVRAGFLTDPEPAAPSWSSQLRACFQDEIQKLQGLAIGASLGVVRDLLNQSAPHALRTQLGEIIDGMTEKLGGQPMNESILKPKTNPDSQSSTV